VAKTIYLTLEQVIVIHDRQIELFGGIHGISRFELLESAIMRPQATFSGKDLYPTVFLKAAAMMHSIVMNHAFVDGNKRTGTVSGLVFLELNGFRLDADHDVLIDAVLKVESKKWNIEKLANWLKTSSKKIS